MEAKIIDRSPKLTEEQKAFLHRHITEHSYSYWARYFGVSQSTISRYARIWGMPPLHAGPSFQVREEADGYEGEEEDFSPAIKCEGKVHGIVVDGISYVFGQSKREDRCMDCSLRVECRQSKRRVGLTTGVEAGCQAMHLFYDLPADANLKFLDSYNEEQER